MLGSTVNGAEYAIRSRYIQPYIDLIMEQLDSLRDRNEKLNVLQKLLRLLLLDHKEYEYKEDPIRINGKRIKSIIQEILEPYPCDNSAVGYIVQALSTMLREYRFNEDNLESGTLEFRLQKIGISCTPDEISNYFMELVQLIYAEKSAATDETHDTGLSTSSSTQPESENPQGTKRKRGSDEENNPNTIPITISGSNSSSVSSGEEIEVSASSSESSSQIRAVRPRIESAAGDQETQTPIEYLYAGDSRHFSLGPLQFRMSYDTCYTPVRNSRMNQRVNERTDRVQREDENELSESSRWNCTIS